MKNLCAILLVFVFPFVIQAQAHLGLDQQAEGTYPHFQKLVDSSKTFYSNGEFKKSLALNLEILREAQLQKDPYHIYRGYRLLGLNYLAMSDKILAKESFLKAEKYATQSKNETALATSYFDLGTYYLDGEKDEGIALAYLENSIAQYEKLNDSIGLSNSYFKKAQSYMLKEDYNETYVNLIRARKYNLRAENNPFTIRLNTFLAKYYLSKENYETADMYLNKSIKAAREQNLSIELQSAYEILATSLYDQALYKEAFETTQKLNEYRNSLDADLLSEEAKALSAKFQLKEYRKEAKEAELKNQLQAVTVLNKSRINKFLWIVSASFLILLFVLVVILKRRKQLVQQLRVKNREYLKAKKQSERLSKAKSNFFSTVSHELRTPLYGVIGLSSILLEDETLKGHRKDLKSLKFSADYLLALINDVLQINKIDSNSLPDEHSSFNLKELIHKISTSFEYMRMQNNNKIYIHISDSIPQQLKGNSVRLSQILMNLVGNACKFTEDGQIYIIANAQKIEDDKTTINFIVKDTGIGIAKEKHQNIFEEFSQVDSDNYAYQGTGLGLPIVKKLLALSDSSLKLDSELGKGSSFSFSLPYEVEEMQEQVVEEKDTQNTDFLAGKRILIVEDNRINQIVTRKVLEKHNIISDMAENGEEAIEKVKANNYDLVLMDINMPVKNGLEATREIRGFNKRLPIIALTAVEIEEIRNEIYQSGMNDIIVKPYDTVKFINTIMKNIPRQRMTLASVG